MRKTKKNFSVPLHETLFLLSILSTSFFPEEQLLFVVFSSLTFEGKKVEEGGNKNKENRDR